MKRFFYTFIILVLSQAVSAQTQKAFSIEIPAFEKFFTVSTTGVNFRKEPNSQCPILYEISVEDEFEGDLFLVWSNEQHKFKKDSNTKIAVFHPSTDVVFEVFSEIGDWYQTQVDDKICYVSKKLCKEVVLQTIKNARVIDDGHFRQRTIGRYKGFTVSEGQELGDTGITFGRVIQGKYLVTFRSISVLERYDKGHANIKLIKEQPNPNYQYVIVNYGDKNCYDNGGYNSLDYTTFTDDEFGTLLSMADIKGKYRSGSLYGLFNGELHFLMKFDLAKMPKQIKTIIE